jgi:hypothetical protein
VIKNYYQNLIDLYIMLRQEQLVRKQIVGVDYLKLQGTYKSQ